MEPELQSKSIDKYQLFNYLIKDILKLIDNLEQELRGKMATMPAQASKSPFKANSSKLGLWDRFKSILPFKKILGGKKRPSLAEYAEHQNKINEILDEIVYESFGKREIMEQYDVISDVIIKFKKDVYNLIKKYGDMLQPDYDRDVTTHVKSSGSPDPISSSEVEEKAVNIAAYKTEITNGIQRTLNSFEPQSALSQDFFEKGKIKTKHFGDVLEYLVNNEIDLFDEEKINKELSKYNYTSNDFSKILQSIYNKKEIEEITSKISFKDKNIDGESEILRRFEEIAKKDFESAKSILRYFVDLVQMPDAAAENEKNKFLKEMQNEKASNLEQETLIKLNILRKYDFFGDTKQLEKLLEDLIEIYQKEDPQVSN